MENAGLKAANCVCRHISKRTDVLTGAQKALKELKELKDSAKSFVLRLY